MMYKKNTALLAGILCCLLLFAFCKAKKVKTTVAEPQEKSAFYTFVATRDSVKKQTVFTLKNVTVTDAKIKYRVDEARAKEANFLKIEVIDKNKKSILAYTEHPLIKRQEVFSESGQIESNLISLPQAEFTLRIPYFDAYKKITLVEVINFKESSPVNLKP